MKVNSVNNYTGLTKIYTFWTKLSAISSKKLCTLHRNKQTIKIQCECEYPITTNILKLKHALLENENLIVLSIKMQGSNKLQAYYTRKKMHIFYTIKK